MLNIINKKFHVFILLLEVYLLLSSCQNNNILSSLSNEELRGIRLATFNTGSFVKELAPNVQIYGVPLFREVVKQIHADVLFTQEDTPYYTEGLSPYQEFFDIYPYFAHEGSTLLNYYGVYSNYPIVSSKSIQFKNFITHTHYMVVEIDISGTVVAFANIHLDWCDIETRKKQLYEVRDHMTQYNNSVIVGDFNPDNYVDNEKNFNELTYEDYSTWKEDFKIFTNAGYEYVNAGELGYCQTFYGIQGLTDNNVVYPLDNIMYKKDFFMLKDFSVVYYNYLKDHIPLYADFTLIK